MKTTPFPDSASFRAWLEKNQDASEIYVRCAKVGAGKGLTYKQALDEALCVGWIDGVRHSLDASAFSVRFTPRKPKSKWSTVNIKRYQELAADGRVGPAGRRAFDARVKSAYSFESRPVTLSPALLRTFRKNAAAFRFFEAQPPSYRRTSVFWVMSAKKEETRERRLADLIARSARGESLPALKRPAKR